MLLNLKTLLQLIQTSIVTEKRIHQNGWSVFKTWSRILVEEKASKVQTGNHGCRRGMATPVLHLIISFRWSWKEWFQRTVNAVPDPSHNLELLSVLNNPVSVTHALYTSLYYHPNMHLHWHLHSTLSENCSTKNTETIRWLNQTFEYQYVHRVGDPKKHFAQVVVKMEKRKNTKQHQDTNET